MTEVAPQNENYTQNEQAKPPIKDERSQRSVVADTLRKYSRRFSPLAVLKKMAEGRGSPVEKEEPGKRERIPHEELEKNVNRYKNRYNLPKNIVDKSNAMEAYIVDQKAFEDEYEASGKELQGIDPLIDSDFIQQMKDGVKTTDGSTIQRKDGRIILLIKDQATNDLESLLNHEVLHALASKGFGKGGGFRPELRFISSIKHNRIDEAATEALRLATRFPDSSPRDIHGMITSGEIKVPYPEPLLKLLAALDATQQEGGIPVSFRDLANFYFGIEKTTPDNPSKEFAELLMENTPHEFGSYATRILMMGMNDVGKNP